MKGRGPQFNLAHGWKDSTKFKRIFLKEWNDSKFVLIHIALLKDKGIFIKNEYFKIENYLILLL